MTKTNRKNKHIKTTSNILIPARMIRYEDNISKSAPEATPQAQPQVQPQAQPQEQNVTDYTQPIVMPIVIGKPIMETVLLSLDDVIVNLNVLSNIKVGNKLYHNNNYLNINNNYFSFIYRWYNNINRHDSIEFINIILVETFKYNNLLYNNHVLLFRLTDSLQNSINGLENLKITYNGDKLIVSKIDCMIDSIRSKIDENFKLFKI
jgi:hypothetical protein